LQRTLRQQSAAPERKCKYAWLSCQVVPVNSAGSVRGPRHVVTTGQTPVLDPAEARAMLESIDTSTPAGLRDRALIGLMVYSFARIGAALSMAVEEVGPPLPRGADRSRHAGLAERTTSDSGY
jgi:site-specific recombinase XerC